MENHKPTPKSFQALISGETPVLVDFFAEWCGPCKMMAPVLSQLAADPELNGKVHIIKIDVDKNPAASSAYRISGVPTLMLFKENKVLWRQSGVLPASEIKKAILYQNL